MPWFRVPFVLGAEELALLLVPNRSTLNNVNIMLTIDIVNTRNTRRRMRGFGDGMCSESLPRQEAALEKTESLLEEIVIGQKNLPILMTQPISVGRDLRAGES